MSENREDNELIKDLDYVDKEIIRVLFENARLSVSNIAKKIKKSKEVVNYRLRRLEKTGLNKNQKVPVNRGQKKASKAFCLLASILLASLYFSA